MQGSGVYHILTQVTHEHSEPLRRERVLAPYTHTTTPQHTDQTTQISPDLTPTPLPLDHRRSDLTPDLARSDLTGTTSAVISDHTAALVQGLEGDESKWPLPTLAAKCGQYFIGYDSVRGCYVPNAVLRARYPDDVCDGRDVVAIERAVCAYVMRCV